MLESNAVPDLVYRWQRGESEAFSRLYGLCGAKMRRIAGRLMIGETKNHTLQSTALIHEMYLKLNRCALQVTSSDHFFNIAGQVMRRLLIDHARSKAARRQATVRELIQQLPAALKDSSSESAMAIQLVVGQLRSIDPLAARTVWLRTVEGYTIAETAQLLDRPTAKVREDYDFAIQWLRDQLAD